MPEFYIFFVEPESQDNVGAISRVMANFGFRNLIVVNPQVDIFGDKVKIVARSKGWEIIKRARILNSLEEALDIVDLAYGTSGISSKKGSEVLRNPLTPREFASEVWKYDGKIGIFFGRESSGFSNDELQKFDALITIPADEEYPIMNITHAAAIILYEIFYYKQNPIRSVFKLISNYDKKILIRLIDDFIKVLPTQEFRKPVIKRVLHNLIGKAFITEREFSVLAGIFRIGKDALEECIKNKK